MTRPEHLDSVSTEQNAETLSNIITNCMIAKEMTLECLDRAYENIKEVYRRNAIIKKAD